MRSVIASPASFITRFTSADFEGCLDLYRDAAGQRAVADSGPGVPAGIAEHFDHQVGSAVDHLRHVGEVGRAIDEAAEPQATPNPVEIAAAGDAQLSQDIEGAEPRRRPALVNGNAAAELADMTALAIPDAELAGYEDEIAGHRERHVIGDRRG